MIQGRGITPRFLLRITGPKNVDKDNWEKTLLEEEDEEVPSGFFEVELPVGNPDGDKLAAWIKV